MNFYDSLPLLNAYLNGLAAILLTIGLMRIVAEGGIYWFQSHTSFLPGTWFCA